LSQQFPTATTFDLLDTDLRTRLTVRPALLRERVRNVPAFSRFLDGERDVPLFFWRTSTGLEVDLLAGDLDLAIEFKARSGADDRDVKGLRALLADQRVRRAQPRRRAAPARGRHRDPALAGVLPPPLGGRLLLIRPDARGP
jgi:hypothetical protein